MKQKAKTAKQSKAALMAVIAKRSIEASQSQYDKRRLSQCCWCGKTQ